MLEPLFNSVRLIDMNVELPQNLEDYVSELVHSSGYKGPDEVVLEALREHQLRRQGMNVTMTPELEQLLDEGLENLEHAKTTDELRRRWRLPGSARRPNATWTGFFVLSLAIIPTRRNGFVKIFLMRQIFWRNVLKSEGGFAMHRHVTQRSGGLLFQSFATT